MSSAPCYERRRERLLLLLSGCFLVSLVLSNVVGLTRFVDLSFSLGGWHVPLILPFGVLPYPITFLCTDLLSECYGKQKANDIVWIGFILNGWVLFLLWLGGLLPSAVPDPSADPAFFLIRTLVFGSILSSMVAYLIAQFLDISLFHYWKEKTRGRHLWLRNNGSTLVSQGVDTVIVVLLTYALTHHLPIDPERAIGPQLGRLILSSYFFKACFALLDTIPFYLLVKILSPYLRIPPAHQKDFPSRSKEPLLS